MDEDKLLESLIVDDFTPLQNALKQALKQAQSESEDEDTKGKEGG